MGKGKVVHFRCPQCGDQNVNKVAGMPGMNVYECPTCKYMDKVEGFKRILSPDSGGNRKSYGV